MFYCCIFEENKLAVENKLNQYRQGHFAPLSAFCNKSRHSFRAFFKVVYLFLCGKLGGSAVRRHCTDWYEI